MSGLKACHFILHSPWQLGSRQFEWFGGSFLSGSQYQIPLFFQTQFLCIALALLELSVYQAGVNSCLPLPPEFWD